uniref:Uncharacterized protein n=1 Tax=Rhizophora mucronata TaxID=61149 RepID=A0A2P2PZH2_RHIMU
MKKKKNKLGKGGVESVTSTYGRGQSTIGLCINYKDIEPRN